MKPNQTNEGFEEVETIKRNKTALFLIISKEEFKRILNK